MVTCYVKYVINTEKLKEFEEYGRRWIKLVRKFGGNHHGYYMPSEGADNVALALFSFPSIVEYEEYRKRAADDPECQAVVAYAGSSKCIESYERSFFRPVFG